MAEHRAPPRPGTAVPAGGVMGAPAGAGLGAPAGRGTAAPPGTMALFKYEALGNDFLVFLDAEGRSPLTAELARAACDRHRGWGADGLLRASPAPAWREQMGFELRNADGSEAETSGNGLRCLVHAAMDEGLLDATGVAFDVLTPAGRRRVQVRERRPGWMWAATEMGVPKVRGGQELCHVGYGQLMVDVGNPHLVVLGPDPAALDVAALGPALSEEAGKSTGGANVEFVALGPGPDELRMRVWERGVGETLACGSGSVAAAAALRHWGRVGTKVMVNQLGGAVQVELGPDGAATLSGPSRRVGQCWFPAHFPSRPSTPVNSAGKPFGGAP
ncbi:MAG: diaminopimelate epimerase [Acidimicrobiales bacterium]